MTTDDRLVRTVREVIAERSRARRLADLTAGGRAATTEKLDASRRAHAEELARLRKELNRVNTARMALTDDLRIVDFQLTQARTAAERLLHMEREHTGSGREGHLSERDLAPLLHALQIDPEEADQP